LPDRNIFGSSSMRAEMRGGCDSVKNLLPI
jgi:hypothetical protein